MRLSLRAWVNRARRRVWHLLFFRMLFGERSADGRPLPFTRVSPSTCIEHADRLALGDEVFIGHFNFIEASHGVRLDTGVQVTNYVSIVTHSSHRTLRLMGHMYARGSDQPSPALVTGPVHVGAFSFIGPHTVIEPGTTLGKGCLVLSHSRVRGTFPDFAVVGGTPARQVGDTREADEALLQAHPAWRAHRDAWAKEGA
mgnify:CR=1 FL=1